MARVELVSGVPYFYLNEARGKTAFVITALKHMLSGKIYRQDWYLTAWQVAFILHVCVWVYTTLLD